MLTHWFFISYASDITEVLTMSHFQMKCMPNESRIKTLVGGELNNFLITLGHKATVPTLLSSHVGGLSEYIDFAFVVDADQHRKTSINQFKAFFSFCAEWRTVVLFWLVGLRRARDMPFLIPYKEVVRDNPLSYSITFTRLVSDLTSKLGDCIIPSTTLIYIFKEIKNKVLPGTPN